MSNSIEQYYGVYIQVNESISLNYIMLKHNICAHNLTNYTYMYLSITCIIYYVYLHMYI